SAPTRELPHNVFTPFVAFLCSANRSSTLAGGDQPNSRKQEISADAAYAIITASDPQSNGALGIDSSSSRQNRSSRPLRTSRAHMHTGRGRSPAGARYSKSHAQISRYGNRARLIQAPAVSAPPGGPHS